MVLDVEDLRVVILDNVKKNWSNSLVRDLFAKTLQLKFDGYSSVYGDNVISVDKVDFFGVHLIVCHEINNSLEPLFAFKSVSSKRCKEFLHGFPITTLIGKDGNHESRVDLEKLLTEIKGRGEEVSYESSLAQSVWLRRNKSIETKQLIHDLTMMLAVSYHQTYKIENMLACGVLDVKTHRFFEKMGLKNFSENSFFKQSDINSREVTLMHTRSFSAEALRCAEIYKNLWESRIEILEESAHADKFKLVA